MAPGDAETYLALVAGADPGEATDPWAPAFAVEGYVRRDEAAPPPFDGVQRTVPGARYCESWMRVVAAGLRQDDARPVALAAARVRHLDERADLVADLAEGWACWMDGTSGPDAGALHKRGAALRFPSLTIEAMSLAALMELEAGDFESALRRARRASRMARAEAIPYAEILANVVLARVRRLQGRPHLALRILTALRRYAPSVWTRWIDWEALLAGQWSSADAPLPALLRAARGGDVYETRVQLQRLHSVGAPKALARDAALAGELFEPAPGANLAPWQRGDEETLPLSLQGLAYASEETSSTELHAWIAVGPEGARRVPHVAAPLAEAEGFAIAKGRRQPRADAALALLALARSPLTKTAYFEALYGFEYDPALHGAMLSMHLGRLGRRLGDRGELILGDVVRIEWKTRSLIPEPRCAELLPQRALRVLAEHSKGLAARNLAEHLSSDG
ncbi:MAG: hypothetical protein AAF411_29305 [Myxococcota bacterium]